MHSFVNLPYFFKMVANVILCSLHWNLYNFHRDTGEAFPFVNGAQLAGGVVMKVHGINMLYMQ